MAARLDPYKLLTRSVRPEQLLRFLRALEEETDAAFANAEMLVQDTSRPAVQARGSVRRWLLDMAFRRAAAHAGVPVTTGYTSPPSWSFPQARIGAFTITLGVVDRGKFGHKLRGRGDYVRKLAARNAPLNPQASLFSSPRTSRIIPAGSMGALMVVEHSAKQPDAPIYLGLYVPEPNLRFAYYNAPVHKLVSQLKTEVVAAKKTERLVVARKQPTIKRRRTKSED